MSAGPAAKSAKVDVSRSCNVLQRRRAGGTLAGMPWVVQRYIDLAAGATLYDPDPTATQPGETPLDGSGQPIPIVSVRNGQVWGDAQVVDDAGVVIGPGSFTVSMGFAKRTVSEIEAAGGGEGRPRFAWNRGQFSVSDVGAVEQTQAGMEPPASVVLVVISGTNAPASGRLAVRIWEGDR